ncbi:unnamed protein product [Ectocarpus sp. 13 AM-2016]
MGNGNTKPPLGSTEFGPEAEELASLSRQKSASAPRVSSKRHAPFGDTNAATTIGSSTKTDSRGYAPTTVTTSKDRLVAPSSNPLPPAACSTSSLPTEKNGNTNPNVASPVRAVFSASLERSLGKRRPDGLRCSSSWTSGKLTRETEDANTTAAAAVTQIVSSSSSLSRRRRWMEKAGDGVDQTIKATGRQTSSTAPTPATTTSTTTITRQDKKKERRRSVSRTWTEASRQGEEGKARGATTRSGSKTHRWDGLRRNRLAAASRLDIGGDGDSVTFAETVADTVDNDNGLPEDLEQQCQGDLVPPSPAVADSSLEPVGDRGKKTAGGAATKEEEQGSHSRTGGRECQHPPRDIRRSGGGNQRGTLPMVKCWEGNPFAKDGGKGGGGEEERRPHRRPMRSRSHADKTFLQRTSSGARNPSSFVAASDGKNIRNNNRMEAGSAGVAATTTESGGGAAFGRASSEGLRVRQQGGRRAGMQAVRGGGGGGGGGRTLPSSTAKGDRVPAHGGASTASLTSPPPQLQLPVASAEDTTCFDLAESRSVSSANSAGVVQEQLSVCSSLPPMGSTGNGTGAGGGAAAATDLIFEESSFEDSVASVSQASSAERCGVEALGSGSDANGEGGGGRGGGGGIGGRGGKRGRGGPAPRQRSRSSSDEFVRTRSVGRGLSNLMARIHEQDELGGNTLESQWKTLPRDLDSRPGAGEVFRVQELSDCDEDGLESVLATSSPPAVTTAAAATIAAVNMGHQRASLELRNLALEREVEQLKTYLRSMGGDDVINTDRHLHGVRPKPRPQQQQRVGEQVLLHHSAAPPPVSDPPPSITHRSGGGRGRNGGSSWRSGGGGDVTARGKADVGRARRWSDNRRGGGAPDPSAVVIHAGRHSPRAAGEPDGGAAAAQDDTTVVVHEQQQPAPSPPRKRGGGGGRRAAAAAAAAESPATSPPVRTLRSDRLRSPVCAAGASVAQAPPRQGGGGTDNVRSLEATGVGALDGFGGTSKSVHRDEEEKVVLADPRQTPRHDSSGEVGESRPLPRLRVEEAERRRGALAMARQAKKPMNLGGMVSGMKHTLLSRRRSAGDKVTPLVVPAGTRASAAPALAASGGGGGTSSSSGQGKEVTLSAADPDAHYSAAADDTHEATTTEQTADKAKQRGSHRPARGGERGSAVSSSSSVPPRTASTETGTTMEKESQRGRGVFGGPTRGVRGGGAGEGTPASGACAKQALTEGISSAIPATLPFEHLPTEASGKQRAETATEGVAGASVPAAATVEVAAVEAGAAVADEVEDIAENSMPVCGRWPATLDARWAEVEFMLCHEVDCEESLQYTIEATEAGLVFMDKLEEKAQELGVLKGQLSRWLLPFNADTSVEEQQAATPRRFQESLLASSSTSGTAGGVGGGGDSGVSSGGDGGGRGRGSGGLTKEEAEYLTDGARRVRQLVRLKIADDNDLNTAKEALMTMSGFFVSISEEAAKRGSDATAFGVLQERRAMSPIMRPPPLPSIPRQAPATATTRATDHHHSATPVSATTKHTDPQKLSDCDGRGASRTPASTDTSASVGKVTGLKGAQQGDRDNITTIDGGGRRPEANAPSSSGDKNRNDDDIDGGGMPFPTARAPAAGKSDAASVAYVDEAAATAATATGNGALSSANNPLTTGETTTWTTTATPTELTRTPPDSSSRSQENTAAEAAATRATLKTEATAAHTSERPGALRGVGGSRQQARVAGKETIGVSRSSRGRASTSKDPSSTTMASADIAGGERGIATVSTAATVPSALVEHSPRYGAGGASGTAAEVAPAGSLVRLKRRQQARVRSTSQR